MAAGAVVDRPAGRALVILLGLALLVAAPKEGRAAAGEACRDQAVIAERAVGVPDGLLLAIGKRESGRFDAQTGGVLPWPWAVNREGEGHLFETREEAIAYVAAAQRQGSRSIDVGCFQINLKHHPIAFASLEEAFDPARNAAYAARFLTVLHEREGNWETAVADYHSATPLLGVPYRQAVFATWHGAAEMGSRFGAPLAEPGRVVMGIRIWTSGAASFYPTAYRSAETVLAAQAGRRPGRDLPRVITPSTPVASRPESNRRFRTGMIANLRR